MSRFSTSILLAALCALFCFHGQAKASNLAGQQIVSTFSNPVLMGSLANNPVAGQLTYSDNSLTAVYSIANGSTISSLQWGNDPGQTGFTTFSELEFIGNTISASPTTPFTAGTIVFSNGTSASSSLIFGATLNFYAGSVSAGNFLGSDSVIITSTGNVFGVPGGLATGDDDYINICGNNSNICNTSIEAVESSEGGQGLSVNLAGTITGDPTLTVTGVSLVPGQTSSANGVLLSDPPLGAVVVPEPATWLPCGLAGVCLLRLRAMRRRPRANR